jgi:hypothetical protein
MRKGYDRSRKYAALFLRGIHRNVSQGKIHIRGNRKAYGILVEHSKEE